MTPSVHILATCRNPELFDATTLVFKTIRVGFPSAEIFIHDNQLSEEHREAIMKLCRSFDTQWEFRVERIVHHEWIRSLIEQEEEPFFICDTDQVFWNDFEQFDFSGSAMAGRRVPRFYDEVTRCITYERLHTSLLYLDAKRIRARERAVKNKLCQESPFYVEPDLITPQTSFLSKQAYFHDTTSLLYNAIGGAAFTEEQLDCFDHCHCGTYVDILYDRMAVAKQLREEHKSIFKNPELAKGLWRKHDAYYAKFAA